MKNIKTLFSLSAALIPCVLLTTHIDAQNAASNSKAKATPEVVSASDVKWGALNPARGEKGPRAGNLWGDRAGNGTTGFLVKFADGFSSPPHIHNVTYRGVVISGLVHNDDPEAKEMWMPAGSFWTQPAGEVHITAAKGSNVVAYIEIDKGPYLVLPQEESFDRGERPINVDASNIVWLDASDSSWIDRELETKPEIAFLWSNVEEVESRGSLVKLPVGFKGSIRSDGEAIRAVVIKGRPSYRPSGEGDIKTLEPGNYFGSEGNETHELANESDEESIIYVRTEGGFHIVPAQKKK